MNRRTFVLLSGATSGSLLVPLRESAGWIVPDEPDAGFGRLSFQFDDRHRWSLWYRGEGSAVPVLPFTSAGIHLGDRMLTLGELEDVSLQAGTPPRGESTLIRGRGAGLFVEATFLTEPSAPAPRARVTIRIYPDTALPALGGVLWATLGVDRTLPGAALMLALVDERTPASTALPSPNPEIRSTGSLALTRWTGNGPVRSLAIIPDPAGPGLFNAAANGDQLHLDTLWTPPRPVSTGGDSESVTICYHPRGDGVAALAVACTPAAGDQDLLATLDPPAGLWLSGVQGRGEDLLDLLERASPVLDPRFARFVAFGPGDGSPRGHRWCTDQIHAAGLLAAGSIAPFAGDDGSTLDPGDPAVASIVRERARVATQEWGYDALILHSLDSVFQLEQHQGNLTHAEALRAGLVALHEGAGSALLWSASRLPQTGTLNVVRVGLTSAPGWDRVVGMAVCAGLRSFYHRSWWLNDPGPVTLGYPLTLVEARTQLSLVALLGAVTSFTADILDIPDAQVDLVRRTVPPAPVAGHPLNAIWPIGDGIDPPVATRWIARSGEWHTALLTNWDDLPETWHVRLADLGLPPGAYVGYDVWNEAPFPVTDPLNVTLDSHDCLVLGVRPRADHPQVIGTTRHVVQGCVDLQDEHWDGKAQTLSGRAVKLDSRPYRVTIAARGWAPDALTSDRPGTVRSLDSEYLVLEWSGGERGDFTWQLTFKRAPASRPRRPRAR
ncbi:MAG TPA: hypothetical protein VH113_11465 [Gemmatimonadales bacterium]|jgi:hypothetical protein|nr:hypothetical protein [Gemmatimonadales bacterium]